MKYYQIKELLEEPFRRLTGEKKTFKKMLGILRGADEKKKAKGGRKSKLTEEKKLNLEISSERAVNENVIGSLKRFKIISDRYRNRRKRFGLRFNLIAGIHNLELAQ